VKPVLDALPPGSFDSWAGDRVELGDLLRRRRESLQPESVGLYPGRRRRTPGLRRAEVARLANMSADYYERLEQARGPQPSWGMLAGIASALRLTPDERDHVFRLAGHASPVPTATQDVDPALLVVLQTISTTTPAFICDDLGNVVTQNGLNRELFGDFAGVRGREGNVVWRWFTSAEWRARLRSVSREEEVETGWAYVADLRAVAAQRGHDQEVMSLIGELRSASAEFASVWEEHPVSTLQCTTKIVEDERVGRLDLDCSIVTSPQSRQRLLLLAAVPGTGTTERLSCLSALIDGSVGVVSDQAGSSG
jgi:transcriptional regulator with XRE-family HTH domain